MVGQPCVELQPRHSSQVQPVLAAVVCVVKRLPSPAAWIMFDMVGKTFDLSTSDLLSGD
jgi:hypothetical protein